MRRRPVLLLGSLALVTAVGTGVETSAGVASGSPVPRLAHVAHTAHAAEAGSQGIGDPYFPLDGNGGIDVLHYAVHDRYDFGRQRLIGTTRLTIRATRDLASFHLDLLLDTKEVRVDGRRAAFRRPHPHELKVVPRRVIGAGTSFVVEVRYAGFPAKARYLGERNWLASSHEVVAMNQPHMAPWWYPSNDHPLDKATHDFHITVPAGKQVIANGRARGTVERGDRVTWHWRAKDPMAPYLAFFAAGDFRIAEGRRGGIPWLVAASERLPGRATEVAMRWLRKSPRIVTWLESELGDYPFESTGGLVTSLSPGFALENQTRPTYPYVGGSATWLLVHELAHQWFGDSVAVEGWRDIWLNEGFATYAEVRYAETHGGPSGVSWLRRTYQQYASDDPFWKLSIADPGPRRLFSGAVYVRGAMALQALRGVIGGRTFATLLRTWAAQHEDGNASTEDFRALAEQLSGRDLTTFFDAWLVAQERPADTAGNGLG